ncbi:toll/interleukin-1 receptor domain-containing protein [Streptomyces sp. NBC_00210]|uniref:TIR domain-containing protein n=1 Tax=Streptomyces sp. NBC_00210 TaxID=2903636 RepID=UPI00324B5DFD
MPPGRGGGGRPTDPTDSADGVGSCWYFLSYSEQLEHRSRVERFHHDIESEIRGLLGNDAPGGGFMDVEDIRTSERWRPRLWNAARSAVCMIVLYSASYFGSEWCGREWAVFVERIRRHESQGGQARYLIGIVWRRGPKLWPAGVEQFQYMSQAFGSMYERHGLFHVVPDGDTASEEYKEIVRAVALEVADAVERPEIPAIAAEEAQAIVPLFGQSVLRTVDIVVSYAGEDVDAAWGQWMIFQLRDAGYSVDGHVLSHTSRQTVDVIRNSLRRAHKVIMVLSDHYLTTGDMTDVALDEALADESSDWQRLFPVVLASRLQRPLPNRIQEISDVSLGGPEEKVARETLLQVAATPSRGRQQRPRYPGFPGVAAPPAPDGGSAQTGASPPDAA